MSAHCTRATNFRFVEALRGQNNLITVNAHKIRHVFFRLLRFRGVLVRRGNGQSQNVVAPARQRERQRYHVRAHDVIVCLRFNWHVIFRGRSEDGGSLCHYGSSGADGDFRGAYGGRRQC